MDEYAIIPKRAAATVAEPIIKQHAQLQFNKEPLEAAQVLSLYNLLDTTLKRHDISD